MLIKGSLDLMCLQHSYYFLKHYVIDAVLLVTYDDDAASKRKALMKNFMASYSDDT